MRSIAVLLGIAIFAVGGLLGTLLLAVEEPVKAPTARPADTAQVMMNVRNEHLPALQKALDNAHKALQANDITTATTEIQNARKYAGEIDTLVAGWSASPTGRTEMERMKFTNTRCPMGRQHQMKMAAGEIVIREHKGQKIALCSSQCAQAWDRLSDADKDAKLKAAGMEAESE